MTATNITLKKFRISDNVADILRGNRELRDKIGIALGSNEKAVRRYLLLNEKESDTALTKPVVVSLLQTETGLPVDHILIEMA